MNVRYIRLYSQRYSVTDSSDAAFRCQRCSDLLLCSAPYGRGGGIKRRRDPSVRLSVPWRSCLGYRHAGCLQLSHRRPPEMCALWTRPQTDVDPPRFLPPSNCHRRGGISSRRSRGDTLLSVRSCCVTTKRLHRNVT